MYAAEMVGRLETMQCLLSFDSSFKRLMYLATQKRCDTTKLSVYNYIYAPLQSAEHSGERNQRLPPA